MSTKLVQQLDRVIIRFAGDSGDGMQLTGDRFTSETALLGNDLSTLPNFPAEIRAPQGTLPGVSSFQLHFADHDVLTPGDAPDVLVAMNPAALKANLDDLPRGATIIVNTDEFTKRNLAKVGYAVSPVDDGSLESYHVHPVALTSIAVESLASFTDLTRKEKERSKNMFALGLLSWLYTRPTEGTEAFLKGKFSDRPDILEANLAALRAGFNYGETTEDFSVSYEVAPAAMPSGTYRNVTGNVALSLGLVAAAHRAHLPLFLGSYPITPASDILHTLAGLKRYGVTTMQAEDEIAGVGAALGASFGGALGVTTTSGPGLALKAETIGLAVSLELPLIVCDIQRGGPSTGLPTKTEQADLLQALFGRNGESPVPSSPRRPPPTASTSRSRRCGSRRPTARPSSCCPTATSPTGRSPGACPTRRTCPTSPSSSRPSPTRRTPRASRPSTPTCVTPRRSRGRGPSPARPVSSTASAGSRRPTSRATSPTTRTTTTT